MNTIRELAEAAVRASGADGWQIADGTAHSWAVTLYFNRDGKDVVARGPSKTIVGLTADQVAPQIVPVVSCDMRGDADVAPADYAESGIAAAGKHANDVRGIIVNNMINDAAEAMSRRTEVSPPAPRAWKWWALNDGGIGYTCAPHRTHEYIDPVTILSGHYAVERIEREAYDRGWDECAVTLGRPAHAVAPRAPQQVIPYLSGVAPVVVEAFTFTERRMTFPWDCESEIAQLDVWKNEDDETPTPCLVAIWPGVGRDGKKVRP